MTGEEVKDPNLGLVPLGPRVYVSAFESLDDVND